MLLRAWLLVPLLSVVLLGLSGCATSVKKSPTTAPDESVLAPAQKALTKANNAHAEQFAPRDIDAAWRRITTARDILYTAAHAKRPLSREEHDRIQHLVSGAQLDARAALTQTQAQAVAAQIAQLQSQHNPQAAGASPAKTPKRTARRSSLQPQPAAPPQATVNQQPLGGPHAPPPGPGPAPATENNNGLPGPIGPGSRRAPATEHNGPPSQAGPPGPRGPGVGIP